MTTAGRAGTGVLFDIDGTLLDTNYLHAFAWWQAMREAGITGVSMADTHQAIGIADAELVQHLTGAQNRAATEAHSRRFDQLQDQVEALAGAADLLQHCAEAGLTVVLATSAKAADLEWMLPTIGVDESSLAGIITSEDVEQSKPHPDLLSTAGKHYQLDPDRTVAVGDTVWDVQAAHDAGLHCIGFTSGGIARCQLDAAGADEVFAGPADLLGNFTTSRLASL